MTQQDNLFQSLGNDFKMKFESYLSYAEKLFHEYQVFTKSHPFLGLFIAIFVIFAILPVLCFVIFSLFATVLTLGGAICIGLFIWLTLLGISGFVFLIAIICVFFMACVTFFWVALAALITRVIFKYMDEYELFNTNNITNDTEIEVNDK